jgi:hypothetical protein
VTAANPPAEAPPTPVKAAAPAVTSGEDVADAARPVVMPIIIIVINQPTGAPVEVATHPRAAELAYEAAAPGAPPVDAPVESATPPILTVRVPIEATAPTSALVEATPVGPGEDAATALAEDRTPPTFSEASRADPAPKDASARTL